MQERSRESAEWVGRTLSGKYRLVRLLGEGGYGAVYEARQEALGRSVAIKRLHLGASEDPKALQRFRREAEACARLGHPHIVAVYDFVLDDPSGPYLVMEVLKGESLAALLRREAPLGEERTVTIFRQILSALSAAHAAGVVHRDIKPGNVFLTESPTLGTVAKVLDFGVVKRTEDDAAPLTRPGDLIGTLSYMPPEQAYGAGIDGRSDLYSVGICMYIALTASSPFPGETQYARLAAAGRGITTPLVAQRPDVDPRLAAIVHKAFALRPEHRFQSADELASALGEWLETRRGPTLISQPLLPGHGTIPPSVAQDTVRAASPLTLPSHSLGAAPLGSAPAGGTGLAETRTAPHPYAPSRPSNPALAPSYVPVPATSGALPSMPPTERRASTSGRTLAIALAATGALVVLVVVVGLIGLDRMATIAPTDAGPAPPSATPAPPERELSRDMQRRSPSDPVDATPPTSADSGPLRRSVKPPADGRPVVGGPCLGAVASYGVECKNDRWTCMTGYSACGDTCVDLLRDVSHCGACGKFCPPAQICSNGACTPCEAPNQTCGGRCVNVTVDLKNCGACGRVCPTGLLCWKGACSKAGGR